MESYSTSVISTSPGLAAYVDCMPILKKGLTSERLTQNKTTFEIFDWTTFLVKASIIAYRKKILYSITNISEISKNAIWVSISR